MKLSLTTRIFVGYAVVLLSLGAVSLFSVQALHSNQLEIRLVGEGYLNLSQTAAAAEALQQSLAKHTGDLTQRASPETRSALLQLARTHSERMRETLETGASTAQRVREFAPESDQAFLAETGHKFSELADRCGAFQLEVDRIGKPGEAASSLERLRQIESQLATNIRLLHGSLQARMGQRVQEAGARERRSGLAIIALAVLAIGVGLLATGIAARSLRPVRDLTEAVSRIGRGDYSANIGIQGDDEIGILAREFDAMARSLREREAQLAEKQDELLRAERLAAVGRISAQVAHEVRNPLSSIGLNVEMLEEQLAEATFADSGQAKETKNLLASVTRELDRLTEITEDYLRLARLPPPTLRRVRLGELIDQVLSFSREELSRAQVAVTREEGEPGLEVSADEAQLRQVIFNLVRNAREAMVGGGSLSIAVGAKLGEVEVRVSDSGPGLSEEARLRLFEPFFSTKEGGTGLGLSIARQIVQAHGGRIEVDPSATRGTTFIVALPRP